MSMITAPTIILFLFIVLLKSAITNGQQLGWNPSFFRIEVNFTRFENPNGIKQNGGNCDLFSKCDPFIFVAIDLDTPLAVYPGSAVRQSQFSLIVDKISDKNVLDMNPLLTQNFCDRIISPKKVTIRVAAFDYDALTGNDLMDNLDCTFDFEITPRSKMCWSETMSCQGITQPSIRLFYKVRVLPIHIAECHSTGLLSPLAMRLFDPTETFSSSNSALFCGSTTTEPTISTTTEPTTSTHTEPATLTGLPERIIQYLSTTTDSDTLQCHTTEPNSDINLC